MAKLHVTVIMNQPTINCLNVICKYGAQQI